MELTALASESRLHDAQQRVRSLRKQRRLQYKVQWMHKWYHQQQKTRENARAWILYLYTWPDENPVSVYLTYHLNDVGPHIVQEVLTALREKHASTPCSQLRVAKAQAVEMCEHSPATPVFKFLEQYRMFLWVFEQNTVHGIAPPTQLLLRAKYGALVSQYSKTLPNLTPASAAGQEKWAQRFRKRWLLRRAKLPTGERLPVQEMRAKVRRPSPREDLPCITKQFLVDTKRSSA